MATTPMPLSEAAPRWAWLPKPGTWKYYALLGAVGILILGPLGRRRGVVHELFAGLLRRR